MSGNAWRFHGMYNLKMSAWTDFINWRPSGFVLAALFTTSRVHNPQECSTPCIGIYDITPALKPALPASRVHVQAHTCTSLCTCCGFGVLPFMHSTGAEPWLLQSDPTDSIVCGACMVLGLLCTVHWSCADCSSVSLIRMWHVSMIVHLVLGWALLWASVRGFVICAVFLGS